MIIFLRKIRQYLIYEKKFSNYLVYAIGEIILVVIGILIALSINNWNEQRKENDLIENFLSRVKLDLNNDKNELVRIIEAQNSNRKNIEYLINYLEGGFIKDKFKQDSVFNLVYSRSSTFYPIVGAYRSALSTGVLGLIKDTKLLNSIVNVYDSYERLDYNGKTLDNKFYKMNEKYKHERRVGRLKSMSSNENIELLDDLNWYKITVEYYINRCYETLDQVDKVIQKE